MGRVGGRLLRIGDQILYRPPSFIGLYPTRWMVRWMYKVDVYLRVRRAVMVDGMSIREVSREFGLHRDTARKMLAYSVPPGAKPAVYTAIQLQIPLLLQLVTTPVTTLLPSCISSRHTSQSLWLHRFI